MIRVSLAKKLYISYTLSGMLPALLIGIICYTISAGAQQTTSIETLSSFRNTVDLMTGQEGEALCAVARAAAKEIAGGALSSPGGLSTEAFLAHARNFDAIDFMALLDESGKVIALECYGSDEKFGFDPANAAFVALGSDGTGVAATFAPLIDVQGGCPLNGDDGQRLGEVRCGRFISNDPFVDRVKQTLSVECTLFSGETRIATTIVDGGKRAVGTKMTNPAVLDTVLRNGGVFNSRNNILGVWYRTVYWPIKTSANDIVGMYFIGLPSAVADKSASNMFWITAAILAVMFLVIAVAARVTVGSITGTLTDISDGLGGRAAHIQEAAAQISAASNSLAEGSTSQASSLEETSSALEQMASMTRQNADNANRTNDANKQSETIISEGSDAVRKMSSAMAEISESAEKIGMIIKTIEDIAFQTNLLALNAAVEAARAGEAGKGFAVVADEVRNLAQRSAQAAGDTTSLIEGTVSRVRNGADIAAVLESRFKEIEEGSREVSRLIDAIARATTEQAQGVDHINTAVAQMDKVTQRNAANSEETASASDELSQDSAALNEMVEVLTSLVEGRSR